MYLARLGDFAFAIDTAAFEELNRKTSYLWSSQNRIGRRPANQFTGIGDDVIDMSGVSYPLWNGGINQMSEMRLMAEEGKPLPFVYAYESVGQYCGLWCIKEISEKRSNFMRDGIPKKIEFQIQIVYYGEDAGGTAVAGSGDDEVDVDDPILGSLADDYEETDEDDEELDEEDAGSIASSAASQAGEVAGTESDAISGFAGTASSTLFDAIPSGVTDAMRGAAQTCSSLAASAATTVANLAGAANMNLADVKRHVETARGVYQTAQSELAVASTTISEGAQLMQALGIRNPTVDKLSRIQGTKLLASVGQKISRVEDACSLADKITANVQRRLGE